MNGERAAPPRGGTSANSCRPQGRPRRFPTPNVHERIHAATARAVAAEDGGLRAVSAEAICFEAEIPIETFHEHFADPRQAAFSAVESFADIAMADCRAALAAAPDWPQGIWDALAVYLDWGACEPDLARLATVEMLAAGAEGVELLRSLMDAFAIFLMRGYKLLDPRLQPPGSLDEPIAAEVLGVVHDRLERRRQLEPVTLLPDLARTVLAPFIGEAETERLVSRMLRREGRG